MKFATMQDNEVVSELCRRIKETRINLRLSQIELAERAELGIATIKRVELGGAVTLTTLISILRALDRLHQLESVLYDSEVRCFNAEINAEIPKPPQRIRKKASEVISGNNTPSSPIASHGTMDINEWYAASMDKSVVWPLAWPEHKK
jgi:transcriptional regulator with XRE-family HTH domain